MARKALRLITALSALTVSGLAVAQVLPLFGTAVFGQSVFGGTASAPTPVPTAPVWMLVVTAIVLCITTFKLKPSTASHGD